MARRFEAWATSLQGLRTRGVRLDTGIAEVPCCIDMQDCMEKGLVRGLASDGLQLQLGAPCLQRFKVERSDDMHTYRLLREDQTFVLLARLSGVARQLDIFNEDLEALGCAQDLVHPVFSLVCHAMKTEWTLVQNVCENCRYISQTRACCCGGRRQIMQVHHSCLHEHHAVTRHMHADVRAMSGRDCGNTEMPICYEALRRMTLDFDGRKVLASAKNFQLMVQGDRSEAVVCQYAKIGKNSFCLDFKRPVTAVEAFSLALSTLYWV